MQPSLSGTRARVGEGIVRHLKNWVDESDADDLLDKRLYAVRKRICTSF